jgi:hypothetical protein
LQRLAGREAAVREPFRGITTDGQVVSGLFSLEPTGVSTRPISTAVELFRSALTAEQRARAEFPVEADAWRRWSNVHPFFMRHGLLLDELDDRRRALALELPRASLSAAGFATARDIMKLNHTIGELSGRLADEYGEWLYWLSLFGTPSADEPWGWQIDGHHLIVNCFALGDQLVTTPLFMGSEPVHAEGGKYVGTSVFEAEEQDGLAFMRSLAPEQQRQARLSDTLPDEVFTAAFRDNFELRYEGIRFGDLAVGQRQRLLALIQVYVGRTRPGHAEVNMAEVERHLPETYFAWMGASDEDSVFYYRIHSPVILIEFDHQRGVALDNDEPARTHIHTIVRTPNGNDYGKDLLRQHHERFRHTHAGGAGRGGSQGVAGRSEAS